jgi:ribonuclease D
VANFQLISDAEALATAVAELRDATRVALDTEGNGMHHYRNRLCLLQLCVAHESEPAETVFLVDPLALSSLEPLAELLGPGGPPVVIHDLAFDARMLSQAGVRLAGVVDTALHARFLGLKETGLGALLLQRFGVQLDKAHQQDDWAKRPLETAQLDYLVADVAYLGPLAASLERDAVQAGIVDEVAVETGYALENAVADEPREPSYARMKGVIDMLPIARAALREMNLVREGVAEREDLPVGRIVSNASLLTLAKQRPRTVHEVRKAGGLYDRGAAIAGELLAAIQRAERAGDVPEDERALFSRPKLPSGEFALRRARETALTAWRRKVAAERNVDVQVVLPGHALSDIVHLAPRTVEDLASVPGLGSSRIARDGATVLAVMVEAEAKKTAES